MTATATPARRLKLASRLLVFGLLVSAATLLWDHPLGFIAFLGIGGSLSAVGGALFLWTVITNR